MRTSVFPCFLALMILLPSCKRDSTPTEAGSGTLSRSHWQLIQIDTIGGSMLLNQADTILLQFTDDRHISGQSPGLCGNTYFGVYSIPAADSIRMDSLKSTEIACTMSRYWHYFTLLVKAERFHRTDEQLRLYSDHGSHMLVFRSAQ